jgi:hypothetical protein
VDENNDAELALTQIERDAKKKRWWRRSGIPARVSSLDTAFGDDGDLWRYKCHTWDMRPTYKTPER